MSLGGAAVYVGIRLLVSFLLLAFLSETWEMLMAGPFAPVAYILLIAAIPGVELLLVPVLAMFEGTP